MGNLQLALIPWSREELLESFGKDSVPLHMTTLIVRASVKRKHYFSVTSFSTSSE